MGCGYMIKTDSVNIGKAIIAGRGPLAALASSADSVFYMEPYLKPLAKNQALAVL